LQERASGLVLAGRVERAFRLASRRHRRNSGFQRAADAVRWKPHQEERPPRGAKAPLYPSCYL